MQQSDGGYLRASKLYKDAPPFSSQDFLIQLAEGKTDLDAIPRETPITRPSPREEATAAD